MFRLFFVPTLALFLWGVSCCRAAAQTDDKSTELAVRKAVTTLQEAFNRADTKDLAACWMPDGEFIGPAGRRIVGREHIEAAFDEYFAAHEDLELHLGIASWRLVTDDVALVELMTELTPAPENLPTEPLSTLVLVRRDGRWLIGSMYEMLTSVPAHRLHLKKLQWLVGDWMEQRENAPDAILQTTCDWNSSGQYLIRKFLTGGEMGETLSGTEIIGWDPRANRIRSWTFEPDGGFGESTWTRDGERWVIKHRGTLANGSDLSVTYLVTPTAGDTLQIEATDRLVNGETQPALPAVTLKRRVADSDAEAAPIELPNRVLP